MDCIQKGASKHTHQFWNTCTSTYLWHIFTLLYSWNTKCLISLKSCTIIYLYFNMYYRNIKCLEIMYHNKFILYCTLKIPNVLKLYTIIYLYFTIYSWNTNVLKLWTMSVKWSVPFQEIADKEIREFPLNSAPVRLHNRCILTSRPRAVLKRWHISRIMFRSLADYNNLSGVTRSSWWFISIIHVFFVHFTLHETVFWCDFY